MPVDRNHSFSVMDQNLKYAIGIIITVILSILAYYLLPAGLVGISMFCLILVIGLIIGFWFSVDRTLRTMKEMIYLLHPPSVPTKSGNPTHGKVFSKCKWMRIRSTDEVCEIYVHCERNLMAKEGCPDGCGGYEEYTPSDPSGTGALGGMVAGGAVGLVGGPLGVILGGIIGGILGNAIEEENITAEETALNVQIRKCEEGGGSPIIYTEI